ncbi:hypothetical protein [Kurthia sp. Dielmo]|uniref:hypothetical protein n=1 Tax=Kurthia sp. Dielmo TaxID=1033738 RepID=UPI001120FDDE|nr:hypothetical protein [Kurthia sp. Dielmo]
MFLVWCIIVIIACYVIMAIWDSGEKKSMENKGYSAQLLDVLHVGGIPNLAPGEFTKLRVSDRRLEIGEKNSFPLRQIKRAEHMKNNELREKQKSVIGRAVAGGLLLGPVAAIIGGLSGVGTKKVEADEQIISIDFIGHDGEERTAVFIDRNKSGIGMSYKEFVSELNKKISHTAVATNDSQKI